MCLQPYADACVGGISQPGLSICNSENRKNDNPYGTRNHHKENSINFLFFSAIKPDRLFDIFIHLSN